MGRRAALVAGASFPHHAGVEASGQTGELSRLAAPHRRATVMQIPLAPSGRQQPAIEAIRPRRVLIRSRLLQFRLPQVRPLQVRPLQVHFLQIRPPQVRLPRPDRRRRPASDGDRPLPRHLQPHPATPSSRRSNTAPGLPRHVTQPPTEGPVTATRHRAGLTRHPVIELAGDGSQRRSCAGGGLHVRQLGRRPSAPLDMVDCLAATRSW